MFFKPDKKTPAAHDQHLSREIALACVPAKNPEIREQYNENGELCLTYQVQIRPWFQGVVHKITGRTNDTLERKLQLDTLGTSVWKMINGGSSVAEIIAQFQATNKLNQREAEISVTSFLKELGKRGLIAIREGKQE